MRVSPDTTSRIVLHFSRISYTMSVICWLIMAGAVLVVMHDGAIGGRQALLLILMAGIGSLMLYLTLLGYLVHQWRIMNVPYSHPPSLKNRTRRIPLNTPSKQYLLEVDE